jgi:mRNA-degrading endonuclease RelE of RelBE toxin-antitoxin system
VALKGRRGRDRFRIGDYRVVIVVDDAARVVIVVDLGHRGTVYRDL